MSISRAKGLRDPGIKKNNVVRKCTHQKDASLKEIYGFSVTEKNSLIYFAFVIYAPEIIGFFFRVAW